jgi:hypothetical protein
MTKYVECKEDEIPEGVRFDVPRHHQGQIVEIAYGGFGRGEHGDGDPFKRVTDQSLPVGEQTTYYRLAVFEKQEVIDRIIARCIANKTWREECDLECRQYAAKGERKAVALYVRERYDMAGAGFSGRWQGPVSHD